MAENKKAETAKKEAAPEKTAKVREKRGPRGPRKQKVAPKAEGVHIGKLIERRMKARQLTKNKLAKVLKLTPPTISLLVNSASVKTDRLITVSEALNYNFFAEVAQMLKFGESAAKAPEPVADSKISSLQGKVADLELELRFIRDENAYLRRIIELMAGGSK